MRKIFIAGVGAVSPAGWNVGSLREALGKNQALPIDALERPGWTEPLRVRRAPAPPKNLVAHSRLRRTSPISTFAVAAAIEALGENFEDVKNGRWRLGIICCVTAGCVQFTRRFYAETWRDPMTASPLIFPETVFNAPSSHLAAVLQVPAINYTLVGEPPTFLQALALGAGWLCGGRADACLVIGAEELDWLTADAVRLFEAKTICTEGAGAVLLSTNRTAKTLAELRSVTEPGEKTGNRSPQDFDSPAKTILGEGLMAGAAWQCVAAISKITENTSAFTTVNLLDSSAQKIEACFAKVN